MDRSSGQAKHNVARRRLHQAHVGVGSDPHKILLGSGNQNRFIRLESAATLARPEVQDLIGAAVRQAKTPLPETGGGYTVIKSISAKQRPRRLPAQ